MEPRLIQHQSQKLVLSPQIRQYLKLLPLPAAELHQLIEAEIIQNPMLEESLKEGPDTSETSETETTESEELHLGESYDHLDQLEEHFRDQQFPTDISRSNRDDLQKLRNFQQDSLTKEEALTDFLLWQIRFVDFSDSDRKIAEEIIGNLDTRGFLTCSVTDIANSSQSTESEAEQILKRVQRLDPPGIAARNLQESLLIQLEKKKENHHLAYTIVKDHLPLLEKRDWAKISKELNATPADVQKAAKTISKLEPYPGRAFYSQETSIVIPDASIFFNDQEPPQLQIEIHDEIIPELRINHYYRKLLRAKETDKQTKEFLRERLQSALVFIRALGLRKSTIRQITEALTKAQPDFFEKGFSHLKPLRLKDIAEQLEIHESTVSRAIQDKYVSTPQGVVPYKSFFSTRLETVEGESESQKSIMERIRVLVEKENPKKPLSDQALVNLLKEEGIKIARRTVAKYRDLLKILPTHLRRQR